MLLALPFPFFASLAVAIESRRPLLCVGSGLILFAVGSVFVALQQKSYWTALNPRAWMGRVKNERISQPNTSEDSPPP